MISAESGIDPERKGRGPRARLPLILALIVALGLGGCGLDTVQTIYIDSPSFSWNSGSMTLQDAGDSSGQSRNFEILYRIYQSSTDATTAMGSISSLAASSTLDPQTVYNQLKNSLKLHTAQVNYGESSSQDRTVLTLADSERGASFFIDATTSQWSVSKISGSSTTAIASELDRDISGTPNINDVTKIVDDTSTDYSPDSTITSPTYPPGSAYLVLCVVAKYSTFDASSNFATYYSLPAPLIDSSGSSYAIQIPTQ